MGGSGGSGAIPDFVSAESLLRHPRFDQAVSILIDGPYTELAVRTLHSVYGLDKQ